MCVSVKVFAQLFVLVLSSLFVLYGFTLLSVYACKCLHIGIGLLQFCMWFV